MKTDISELIGRSEAGRRLGVSGEMVHILMRTGRLPFIKTALGRLIDPADVEKLARSRKRAALAAAATETD